MSPVARICFPFFPLGHFPEKHDQFREIRVSNVPLVSKTSSSLKWKNIMKDTAVRTSSIFLTALQSMGILFIRGKTHPMNYWQYEVTCPVLRDRHPNVNKEYHESWYGKNISLERRTWLICGVKLRIWHSMILCFHATVFPRISCNALLFFAFWGTSLSGIRSHLEPFEAWAVWEAQHIIWNTSRLIAVSAERGTLWVECRKWMWKLCLNNTLKFFNEGIIYGIST